MDYVYGRPQVPHRTRAGQARRDPPRMDRRQNKSSGCRHKGPGKCANDGEYAYSPHGNPGNSSAPWYTNPVWASPRSRSTREPTSRHGPSVEEWKDTGAAYRPVSAAVGVQGRSCGVCHGEGMQGRARGGFFGSPAMLNLRGCSRCGWAVCEAVK
jgi:hypothetical protein